jgi:hypothetical protein
MARPVHLFANDPTSSTVRSNRSTTTSRGDPIRPTCSHGNALTGYFIVDVAMRALAIADAQPPPPHHGLILREGSPHRLADVERHFRHLLTDGDVRRTRNWQWSLKPDPAAPYFRVLNLVMQAQRFDPTVTMYAASYPNSPRYQAQASTRSGSGRSNSQART